MQRVLEPEVMDTRQEAAEYDAMDLLEVNTAFAQRAMQLAPTAAKVLDAGTGTARIPILICQERPQWKIVGIDLAHSMLEIGWKNIAQAGFSPQITLESVDAKQMPYQANQFDLVISNSLIHHLPRPLPFLQEVNRVLKPSGAILMRDLIRPASEEEMKALVAEVGAEYDAHQTKLFRDSLHAAFTLSEVNQLVQAAGLESVSVYHSSERHWTAERASV